MRGIKSTVLRKISIQVLTLECTEFFDTSFLKGELPNLLNARMDHCWSQIFQKRFLKSICLYLTTTKYDIRRNFLPGAWGRWYKMSIQPLMFPFLLFYFSSCFWGQNPCLYIFPLHLLFSCPQHSNLCSVTPSFEDLNCPNCFLNPSLDATWYKTEDAMFVMCSLPQPNTIYLVLQLGIEYHPGWCYPKV